MAIPTFVSAGAGNAALGDLTCAAPAGSVADDIWIYHVESHADGVGVPSGPAGWTLIDSVANDTGGSAWDTRCTLYWIRYTGTTPDLVFPDTGDHSLGFISAYRGCITTENPINVSQTSSSDASDKSVSLTGVTTDTDDCLIVATSCAGDNVTLSSWTNSSLASPAITESQQHNTASGTDGTIASAYGGLAATGVSGTTTLTSSANEREANIVFALTPEPATGPQSITVNQVTETNLAQVITVATALTVAIGQVTETDLAQIITPSQVTNVAVAQIVETDLAQPITMVPGGVTFIVNQVVETDLAQPITSSQATVVGVDQVNETDLSQTITPVSGAVTPTVNQVIETDLSQTITPVPGTVTAVVGQILEADLAQAIIPSQATLIVVNQVVETDLVQIITPVPGPIASTVNQVVETDLAQTITPAQETGTAVDQVTETDLAQTITPSQAVNITVNQVVETDLAQTITPAPGNTTIAVGQVVETDLAQTIDISQGVVTAVGQVVETDLAQTITSSQTTVISVGQVVETDFAQALRNTGDIIVNPGVIVNETEISYTLQVNHDIDVVVDPQLKTMTYTGGNYTVTVTGKLRTVSDA